MLDLKPRHLEILLSLAAQTLPADVVIWAYGSRAKGQAHSGSDLDLVLRSDEPLPGGSVADFREALTNSNIPFFVDVHDWAQLPESFHRRILVRYEVVRPAQEEIMNS